MSNNKFTMSPESVFYDYQRKMEKQFCQVCQNMAVGFHYGAYVCEACKKFFKRYAFNHTITSIGCKEECEIDRIGRRKCADCRFKKCLRVGMQPSISSAASHNFDISKIPCRICGSKASGFHFGSLTCEGCKGFFRRTEMIKDRLTCPTKGNCFINFSNRSMCKYCRYQQCIKSGMSKSGSRIGRQPNAVKHCCVLEIATHDIKVEKAYTLSESSVPDSFNGDPDKTQSIKFETVAPDLIMSTVLVTLQEPQLKISYTMIIGAISILQMPFREAMSLLQIHKNPLRHDQTLIEVWNTMMQHFDVHSHMLIQFAKRMSVFNDLVLVDKRSLVQEAMYPIMLLNLSRSYDHQHQRYNYFDFSEEEYEIILDHFPNIHVIMGHVMNISTVVHDLGLSHQHIGIFCVIELLKNFHDLESSSPVKLFYDHAIRVCWASIIDLFIESAERRGHSSYPVSDIDISSYLHNINCPVDLVDIIAQKISMSDIRTCLHKLQMVFVHLGQWLHKYNVDHQAIIDQLKVKNPELPYSDLYVEMFQLSTEWTVQRGSVAG